MKENSNYKLRNKSHKKRKEKKIEKVSMRNCNIVSINCSKYKAVYFQLY